MFEGYTIRLVGEFALHHEDTALRVRRPVARLIALLAVTGGSSLRTIAAASLWPDVAERRALANLRSVIWHSHPEAQGLVCCDADSVWLATDARVDCGGDTCTDELLPDWQEEWLLLPRFFEHQLRSASVTSTPV